MPKHPKPQPNIPPAKLIPGTKDPILSTGPPTSAGDWKVKNVRAKELIMSTLVPGSEPWKIAEPLELASDIWKALEAKYAPVDAQTATKEMREPTLSSDHNIPNMKTAVETFNGIPSEADLETKRRQEAQARATKEFNESMPNRDQRFLWALLHGGKEETNTWFYGSSVDT